MSYRLSGSCHTIVNSKLKLRARGQAWILCMLGADGSGFHAGVPLWLTTSPEQLLLQPAWGWRSPKTGAWGEWSSKLRRRRLVGLPAPLARDCEHGEPCSCLLMLLAKYLFEE